LTWKPLHFRRIHIPRSAIACSTSLFPSLVDFTNQVPSNSRFQAFRLIAEQRPLRAPDQHTTTS